jgi:hypothetical protein
VGSKQQEKKSSKHKGQNTNDKSARQVATRDAKVSGKKVSGKKVSGKRSALRTEVRVADPSSELPSVESPPAVSDVDVRLRELQLRLALLQDQFVGVVEALGESTARLQAAVGLIADLPTRDAATDSARELRQRLEQMLVAQQRTNELLDLALGVAASGLPSTTR